MLRKLFVLPVLSLLLLPAVSQAVVEHDYGFNAGNWDLTLAGSGSNDQDFHVFSASANAGLGYFLSNMLEVGARQTVNYTSSSPHWGASTRGFLDVYLDLGQWQPYVGANAGWIYGEAGARPSLSGRDTGVYGPEAGVKYFLTTSAYVFGQIEYDRQCHTTTTAAGKRIDGTFIYTLGLGIKL